MNARSPLCVGAVLRKIIDGSSLVSAPGVYDALSARLAAQEGFQAVHASGGSVVRSMGLPDLGLADLSEMTVRYAQIVAAAAGAPVIADGETGFGNELNTDRAVRALEAAGVAGIHIEDQVFPKRCGQYAGVQLIEAASMAAKLTAALAARKKSELVIIARTDAKEVEGLKGAIDRALQYVQAGADMIFVEGLKTAADYEEAGQAIAAAKLLNAGPPGMRLPLPADRLAELGYRIAVYPADLQCAAIAAMRNCLKAIKQHGHASPADIPLASLQERDELVDLAKWQSIGQR
jgi:2-methylisocitrate lyase-like PEP mutase family enzyme